MNKKTDEEYGIVITREMKAMILNSAISYEDRAKIMCSILSGEELEDLMMRAFADSLRTGFEKINDSRKKSIENRRIRQAEYQRNRRSASTVDERTQSNVGVDSSTVDARQSNPMSVDERASLGIARHSIAKQCNNIPLNPPEGDGHCPPEISIEDVFPEVKNNSVEALADEIEATEAFAHMRVKRRKLLRALNSVLEKTPAPRSWKASSVGQRHGPTKGGNIVRDRSPIGFRMGSSCSFLVRKKTRARTMTTSA